MKNTLVKYNRNSDLFQELTRGIFNDLWIDPLFGLTRNWRPETYKDTEKDYVFEIEIPRVKKDEISCEAIDNSSVRIKVNNDKLRYERVLSFDNGDAANTQIKLEAGVLTVSIPKISLPEPKVKKLEIQEVS